MYQMICSLKVAAIASTGQLCRRRQPSMHRAPLMLGADWICCRTQDGCSKLTGRQAQASGHRQHRQQGHRRNTTDTMDTTETPLLRGCQVQRHHGHHRNPRTMLLRMAGGAYAHSTWGLSASIATDGLDNGRRGAATAALSVASVASPASAPPPTQQQQQYAPPQAFAAQLPSQQQENQEPQPPQHQQQQQCSPPTAFAMGVGSADVHVKAPISGCACL